MLLIGSHALLTHFKSDGRKPADMDFISTYDEYRAFSKAYNDKIVSRKLVSGSATYVKMNDGKIVEFSFAWPGESSMDLLEMAKELNTKVATPEMLLLLKLSHRYKRNSPHFAKTMADIRYLREQGVELSPMMKKLLKKREKETYTYAHPNLNQSKSGFFDATVQYLYEHDDIHEAVAVGDRPAYTQFQKDGAEVRSCKTKFFGLPHSVRLSAGLEESYVLAIERSLVPFNDMLLPHQAFRKALEKVCTSITSGWFREYCWEHYDEIVAMYSDDFYQKFKDARDAGKIRLAQTAEYTYKT